MKYRSDSHAVTVGGYYSDTWDVLGWRNEHEDDDTIVVLASFKSKSDATAFVAQDRHDPRHDIIGLRPPVDLMRHAVEWISIVSRAGIEGLEVTR